MTAGERTRAAGTQGSAAGPLLLADISGRTIFLSSVTDAHREDAFADGNVPDAYALVSSLLDGIIESVTPAFTLARIEGDAVFAFAPSSDGMPRGAAVLDCLAACDAGFRGRLTGARTVWSCRRDACAGVDTLDLTFVLHAGPFVIQQMRSGTELVGPEVVMVHRLLKDRAVDVVGVRPYALIMEAAAEMLDVPFADSLPLMEQYEHLPPIGMRVILLDRSAGESPGDHDAAAPVPTRVVAMDR